jgi:dihydropteroate synthase
VLEFSRTRIMGILNVTPDSFFDGGRLKGVDGAVEAAAAMVAAGVDVLDVGGESTRPGADPVSAQEELDRVLPVVQALASRFDVPISVDTYRFDTAREAVDAGAVIINDVSAGRQDQRMFSLAAKTGAALVLMHALWPPKTMQDAPEYVDVVEDVAAFLSQTASLARAFGVPEDRIMLDPGIGFGKTLAHNLELLRSIQFLIGCGYPVLVGPSRKRFLGDLTGKPVEDRLLATAAVTALLAAQGVHMVRVHDVAAMKDVARVADALAWDI